MNVATTGREAAAAKCNLKDHTLCQSGVRSKGMAVQGGAKMLGHPLMSMLHANPVGVSSHVPLNGG